MAFSEALGAAMKIKGLRAVNIASDLADEPYLSRLLKGKVKEPTWQRALAIIEALGMTPDEFRELELKLEAENKKQY